MPDEDDAKTKDGSNNLEEVSRNISNLSETFSSISENLISHHSDIRPIRRPSNGDDDQQLQQTRRQMQYKDDEKQQQQQSSSSNSSSIFSGEKRQPVAEPKSRPPTKSPLFNTISSFKKNQSRSSSNRIYNTTRSSYKTSQITSIAEAMRNHSSDSSGSPSAASSVSSARSASPSVLSQPYSSLSSLPSFFGGSANQNSPSQNSRKSKGGPTISTSSSQDTSSVYTSGLEQKGLGASASSLSPLSTSYSDPSSVETKSSNSPEEIKVRASSFVDSVVSEALSTTESNNSAAIAHTKTSHSTTDHSTGSSSQTSFGIQRFEESSKSSSDSSDERVGLKPLLTGRTLEPTAPNETATIEVERIPTTTTRRSFPKAEERKGATTAENDQISYLPSDYAISELDISQHGDQNMEVESSNSDSQRGDQNMEVESVNSDSQRGEQNKEIESTNEEIPATSSTYKREKEPRKKVRRKSVKRELPIMTIEEETSGEFSAEISPPMSERSYPKNEEEEDLNSHGDLAEFSVEIKAMAEDLNSTEDPEDLMKGVEDSSVLKFKDHDSLQLFQNGENLKVFEGLEDPAIPTRKKTSKWWYILAAAIVIILIIVIIIMLATGLSGNKDDHEKTPTSEPSITPIIPILSQFPSPSPSIFPSMAPTGLTLVTVENSLGLEPQTIGWNITDVYNSTVYAVSPGTYKIPLTKEYQKVNLYLGETYTFSLICTSIAEQIGRVVLYLGNETSVDMILKFYTYTGDSFSIYEMPFVASEQGLLENDKY